MIVLENADILEGDSTNASEVDFVISGLDNNTLKQLADGQLASSKGTIYTANSTDVVSSIILVNSGADHNHVNLYFKPTGGTSRRLIPKDLQLEPGYSLYFDGVKVSVMNIVGQVIYVGASGAAGSDGDDAYVYIAYASASDGTGFTQTFNAALPYIAVKSTTTAIPAPAASDFTGLWCQYKGSGITDQLVGFTATGGTTPKTLTVALDANVSGTNTGDNSANSSCLALDQTTPQTIANGKPIVQGLQFNSNPTVGAVAEGKAYWDVTHKTLSMNLTDDVNLQVGQETLIRVHNDTVATITNGSVVYLTGASGVYPTVALAKADYEDTYYAVGVATQDIEAGAQGFITRTGKVHDLNTSSYTAGDSIYVSPDTAGAFTNVKPSTLAMRVGRVVVSDATVGSIYVNISQINPQTSSAISAGAAVAFFLDGTDIIAVGDNNAYLVETLSKTPTDTTEDIETVTVNNNTVLSEVYLYQTALDRTSISSGIWKFYSWVGVDTAVGATEILGNLMRVRTPSGTLTTEGTGTSRTATASTGTPFVLQVSSVSDDGITDPSGATIDTTSFVYTPQGIYPISARTSDTVVTITVPTTYTNESAVAYKVHKRLFQMTTGEINNLYGTAPTYTGLQLYTTTATQPAFTIVATDTIAAYRFGKTTRTSNVIIAFSYGGSSRYSYFETPLEVLHGNLPGLQGGTGTVPTEEYYHLTSAQHTVATQAATAALNGYATSTQITKLDGIEALADVTDATNVNAAGAVMESDYNAHSILAATDDNTPAVLTVTEQTVVGRLTSGNISAVAIGIADNNMVQIDSASAATGEYAKFTANGLESKSLSETATDLKDQFPQAITDNHVVTIDAADAADNDYAKFTANGLEGRSYAETLSDIGAAPTASPTFTGTVTLPKTTEIQDTSGDHQYVLAVSELTADRTITLPLLTGTDTFVFQAHTQTLTNKRITQRVVTTADDTTAVIDVDTTDVYELSAIANDTDFSTTGTPTDGQNLIIRFKDDGGAEAITWNAIFVAIGVTAPSTTVAGKWHYVGCQYNSAASKWHILATAVQA